MQTLTKADLTCCHAPAE